MIELMQNWLNWLGELKASDIAVLAASTAAIFTTYQALLLRKHNRLSIKPHLTTWTYDDDSNQNYKIYFVLANNGLGPAIIKDFIVFFDGHKIGDNYDQSSLKSQVDEKAKQKEGILRNTISTLGRNSAFPIGKQEVLFSITTPMHMGFDKSEFQEFIDRFDVDITYTSVYGEKYSISTKENL